jgi:glutathione synthase/RimK-type ligase-like ATP-grasp enzyme
MTSRTSPRAGWWHWWRRKREEDREQGSEIREQEHPAPSCSLIPDPCSLLPVFLILAARTGFHTDALVRAFARRGRRAEVRPYESVVASLGTGPRLAAEDIAMDALEGVLARIIPNGSLEQIIYRVDALHVLEDGGVPVMNTPRAIERTVDKFWASALLERAGLRTPPTVVCERTDDAMAAFRTMGDVVVKPLFGSMGLGMVRVSDEDVAWRVFRALEATRSVYYLQRAIAWRTNISRGGTPAVVALPPEWEAMALCAARAVEAEYAGVDLLPAHDGGVYVLEVNGIPGWRGLQTVTSIDVAAAIVDHLLDVRLAGR